MNRRLSSGVLAIVILAGSIGCGNAPPPTAPASTETAVKPPPDAPNTPVQSSGRPSDP